MSKYKPGANTPSGNTQFDFHAGRLTFSSTSYQWLVVGGARAQYKGEGIVNGRAGYSFLLTAIDGAILAGKPDAFRIKIWETADPTRVVYDNQIGTAEDSDAATALSGTTGGGSIVIHK